MTKFNKQRFWDLRGLFRECKNDIYEAHSNVWETKRAINATDDKKKIKDLKDVLKIEKTYLQNLLERSKWLEKDIEKEIKKGATK